MTAHASPLARAARALLAAWLMLFGTAADLAPQSKPSPAAPRTDVRRGRAAFERGAKAEAAGEWLAAWEAYSEAVALDATNPEWLARRERARFGRVTELTEQAERLALGGKRDAARELLQQALRLDPGYSIARERLQQLAPPPAAAAQEEPALAEGPPKLSPRPGTHSFNTRGDTRSAYQEIGREFGIVVYFDSDVVARAIRLKLENADFATAIQLVETQSGTFYRVLDPHSIFVVQDTLQKRREFAPVVVRTLLLSSSTTPDEMNETVRLVREIAGITRTQLNTEARTLTVRDTPEAVRVAAALVEEIERARSELMLEIEILEVDSTLARSLGVTPPSTAHIFSLNPSQVSALQSAQTSDQLLSLLQSIFGTPASLAGLTQEQIAAQIASGQLSISQLIPPLLVFGGGRSTFLTSLPGLTLTLSQTMSLVKGGRRILLRAQDGQASSFFVGERFPITLALLSSSLGTQTFAPVITSPLNSFANLASGLKHDFPTGAAPAGVDTADFDGDGNLDVAVANQTDGTVSILLGDGTGSLGTHSDFVVGNMPSALVARDFNKDGKVDLAITTLGSASDLTDFVTILPGQGNGTFPGRSNFPVGRNPVAIAVADFNADGFLDLAVVNQASNTVSILLGKGDGTFAPKTDFPTGAGPVAIAVADFNGDGKLDLAVVNQTDNTVSILLGDGTGSFGPATNFATGASPSGVAVADFNADSKLDLAVTNQTDNTVSIFLGNGDGTFRTPTTVATGTGPRALIAANLQLLNFVDLITVNQSAGTISIFPGNGDGTFATRLDLNVGSSPIAVATGDLNKDSRPDLIVSNQSSNNVSVILNSLLNGGGQVGALAPYPGSSYEDIGLKVRATPRVHPNHEVTLQMHFEIRNLSGTSVNGIPVISNRELEQTLRLREDETSVLLGVIERNESSAVTGSPGFIRVPGAGAALSEHEANRQETQLIITVTPRRIRAEPRIDRTIYAGRGSPDRIGTAGAQPQ